jgi:hypothetical protein
MTQLALNQHVKKGLELPELDYEWLTAVKAVEKL